MSFDLGVWYSEVPMSSEEAGAYYHHINSDWVVVRRAVEIDAFLRDLLERFPDGWYPKPPPDDPEDPPAALLRSAAELRAAAAAPPADWVPPPWPPEELPEDMPWATSPISAQGSTVTLSISFSAVRRTAPVVHELAMRHGLVFYDPQSDYVALPPSLVGKTRSAPLKQSLVLRVSGNSPSVRWTLMLDGATLIAGIAASRREAHVEARRLAISKGLDRYQVDDPGSLSQSMRWDPVADDGVPPEDGVVISRLRLAEPPE